MSMSPGTRESSVDKVMDASRVPELFDEAFVPLFRGAYLVAFRMLRDVDDAEDVAADALASALVCWDEVSTLPHRDAWVMRVAANLAVDRLRRRGRVRILQRVLPNEDSDVALCLDLARALRKLPRRQREVIVLRYIAGLPEREVADALALSQSTVKEHSARGRLRLRRILGSTFEEVVTCP